MQLLGLPTRYGTRGAIALFFAALLLTLWSYVATNADRARIATQNDLILSLERLLSMARDIETSGRGYVLVGTEDYLQPYNAAVTNLDREEGEARAAFVASGGGERASEALFDSVRRKRDFTARLIEMRRAAGFDAALPLVASGEGKELMDLLRGETALLQGAASMRRDAIVRADRARSSVLTVLSSLSALAAAAYFGWLAWQRRKIVQRTAAELSGLDDRFKTLADNIPQLTWMADPKGRIYWYNKRWYDYTGTTPADMEGEGWKKAHDPELIGGIAERFMAAITSGTPWQDTFPLRNADGNYRWFLSRAQPIEDAGGKVTRWFGTNTDVTEQRQQEIELAAARDAAEDANRAKSQFLANMSHELRTPLSAVIGYSEMMEEEVEDRGLPELATDLAKIKSNARHLLGLINDVLDISKIEANKMEVFAETFAIKEVVEDVADTVGSLIEKKNNTLHVEIADDAGTMHSDVTKLRQVLINLLSNAAKFTENGSIHLSATRSGDRIAFAVRDTGLGMSPDQLEKLFQRFSQADASTTRKFGGTGLGLAITKAFATMLGGEVIVGSEEGKGSTFTMTLPDEIPNLVETAEGEAVQPTELDEPEDVVLIIDDDPATRELLTRFLTREGFNVRAAVDGRSGLALAQALKPRIILLDVTMPRMDGWEVLRKLKDDPKLAAIPVVMCTVIDEQNLGFSLGASDYLLKPVDWDRLREVLARVERETPHGDVLVVDDDADTRERLEGLLSKQGWTVTEAENGRAALEAVEARLPTLVLLDLNMPEMDGFTFLREFRNRPEAAAVPVVILTARDLSPGERAELKGGGAVVMQKGRVSMKDLVAQLRAIPARARPAAAKPAPSTGPKEIAQ